MHLPAEAIHEFRAIWREDYGVELPFEEARLVAERFLASVHLMLSIADREEPAISTTVDVDNPSARMA